MIQHAQSVAAEQPSLMANVWKLVAGPDNAEEAELVGGVSLFAVSVFLYRFGSQV